IDPHGDPVPPALADRDQGRTAVPETPRRCALRRAPRETEPAPRLTSGHRTKAARAALGLLRRRPSEDDARGPARRERDEVEAGQLRAGSGVLDEPAAAGDPPGPAQGDGVRR